MAEKLLSGFIDAIERVVVFVLALIGNLLSWIAGSIAQVAVSLLEATVFAPVVLDPGQANGVVSEVVSSTFDAGWKAVAAISAAVALASLGWGVFQLNFRTVKGAPDKQSLAEGIVTYAAVAIGGKTFLFTMLGMANEVTAGLLILARKSLENTFFANGLFTDGATATAGYASGALMGVLAVLTYIATPAVLLFLAGALLWVVGVWLFRMVELVFFAVLLPITSAFSITGSRRAFEWNFQEATGAIFSQMVMALAWYLAWLFMDHTNVATTVIPGPQDIGDDARTAVAQIGDVLLRLLLGAAAMMMVGKAPRMLQNIAGNSYGGIAGIAMGAAGGMLLARFGREAFKMTPAGVAMSAVVRASQAQAAARASAWGELPTAGARISSMIGSTAAGRAIQAGLGAAGQAMGQVFAPVKQRLDWAYNNSNLVRGMSEVVKAGGRRAGAAAGAFFQPRVTFGRMLRDSIREEVLSDETVQTVRAGVTHSAYTEMSKELYPEATDEEHDYFATMATAQRIYMGTARVQEHGKMPEDQAQIQGSIDYTLKKRLERFKDGRVS